MVSGVTGIICLGQNLSMPYDSLILQAQMAAPMPRRIPLGLEE